MLVVFVKVVRVDPLHDVDWLDMYERFKFYCAMIIPLLVSSKFVQACSPDSSLKKLWCHYRNEVLLLAKGLRRKTPSQMLTSTLLPFDKETS